jgi:anti-sigma B factor antagonist
VGEPLRFPRPAPTAELSVQVLSSDGRSIEYVRGELDVYTATALRRSLAELIAGGARHVVLDLRHLSFMSATGLAVLVGAARRLRHHGGELVLRSTRPSVRKLIEITGWEEVLADR